MNLFGINIPICRLYEIGVKFPRCITFQGSYFFLYIAEYKFVHFS